MCQNQIFIIWFLQIETFCQVRGKSQMARKHNVNNDDIEMLQSLCCNSINMTSKSKLMTQKTHKRQKDKKIVPQNNM